MSSGGTANGSTICMRIRGNHHHETGEDERELMAKRSEDDKDSGKEKSDYYDLDGPGKADAHPDKVTKFDRYDWSRQSEPEPLFKPRKR